jgi:hypothetical protein
VTVGRLTRSSIASLRDPRRLTLRVPSSYGQGSASARRIPDALSASMTAASSRLRLTDRRVVEDDAQQRTVHLEPAVVFDQPRRRNLFMKKFKFTRERVVPTISASTNVQRRREQGSHGPEISVQKSTAGVQQAGT